MQDSSSSRTFEVTRDISLRIRTLTNTKDVGSIPIYPAIFTVVEQE